MEAFGISFSALPHTSLLFRDYVSDASGAARLFPYSYKHEGCFEEAAGRIAYSEELRRQVVQVLSEQNYCWGRSAARERNLERLAGRDCLAVVTGQQVGLFTGPAFAIYKALTAIKLAAYLTSRGIEAVPVFWLATEDHDLAEVNHAWVQERDGQPHRLVHAAPPANEDAPAGALRLTDQIAEEVATFQQLVPDTDEARVVAEWLRASYKPGATLGSAFGAAMAQLLNTHGVLTLDPLDARVHRLAGKVFLDAATRTAELRDALLNRNDQLVEAGYHSQVRVQDRSTLLFVYEQGSRSVLQNDGRNFVSASGTQYSPAEVRELAESTPELVSPTALLRPVVQDALLPTVAYVGGPAEIAYLAQAVPLYESIIGRMPVVVPRASITLVEQPIHRVLTKYGLILNDLFAGRQQLREKMAARFFSADLASHFSAATESLERNLASLQQAMQKLDPTLVDAARNAGQKMLYQIANLERKAAASVQGKNDQIERDAARIENALYPEKAMQERVYCGPSLLARFGGLRLVEELYAAIPPLPHEHQVLIPG